MATTYEKAGEEANAVVRRMLNKNHHELVKADVQVECLFARNPKGNSVKLNGYPCLAVVRRTNLKERVHGLADAVITIDEEWWKGASKEKQEALIDHELYHLVVAKDKKTGEVKTDDQDRPKLKMKLHDLVVGGFTEIIKRHGPNAAESDHIKDVNAKAGQLVFGFAKATD